MKKRNSIVMALVLCLAAFVGCGTGTSSESIEELIALGAQYLVDGNYSEAVVAFDKAIKVDDKSIVAYVGLGDANLGLEDYEKAGDAYEKAIAVDNQTIEAYIGRADAYLFEDNAESAVAILNEGYEATGADAFTNILEAIADNRYEPSVLHMDWESMYDAGDSGDLHIANSEESEDLQDAHSAIIVHAWEGSSKDGEYCGWDEYYFDNKGRMTANIWYSADGELEYKETWEYDDVANVTHHFLEERDGEPDDDFQSEIKGCEDQGWYWSSWDDGVICDPSVEDQFTGDDGETYTSRFGYDSKGRVNVIKTYNSAGTVTGYCEIRYKD